MREIKFRAWDTHNKIWLDGHLFNIDLFYGMLHRNSSGGKIGGYKLMQWTGLKDKNGKQIYEGDICKFDTGIIRDIGFFDGRFRPREIPDKEWWFFGEIIGNIYENPELLTPNTQ